jgi:hypothetical protein
LARELSAALAGKVVLDTGNAHGFDEIVVSAWQLDTFVHHLIDFAVFCAFMQEN